MFDYIVQRINLSIPFKASSYYIGVLDIAGFGKLIFSTAPKCVLIMTISRILYREQFWAILHQLLQRKATTVLQRSHPEARTGVVQTWRPECSRNQIYWQSRLYWYNWNQEQRHIHLIGWRIETTQTVFHALHHGSSHTLAKSFSIGPPKIIPIKSTSQFKRRWRVSR